jgi:glycosyltransferase involved in cell wall biosynthesis
VKPLLVDLESEWRGGQNQALLMLKGFRARGHQAELVAVAGSALEERVAAAGIPVHVVDGPLVRAQAALELRRLLKRGGFELVHVNEPHALTAAWLARAHRRVPLVVSRRVGYPLGKSRVARARYEAAAKIVAISQWSAAQAVESGAPADKMTVVYEGIEIPPPLAPERRAEARQRWNIPSDAPVLGCVAVLSPDKGQEGLIRLLASLRKDFPDCRLLLAGDGPDLARLKNLAEQMRVADSVIFAGFVKDIAAVYAALDVFLFPAMFEGLGTSLLAAMSYGIPSIAFDRCAFGEIIESGKSGILVQTSDLPAMENATAHFLRDPGLAGKIGEAARKRIEQHFSADSMVGGMIRVYEGCVSRAL